MLWVFLLVLSIVSQIIAENYVKSYSLSGNIAPASIALFLQIVSSLTWLYYMRLHSTLAIGAGIWSMSLCLASVFIGVVMYHEVLTSQQYIGIMLGMVSLILLMF